MKKLLFILGIFLSVLSYGQVQDTIFLAGKFSFSQSGGGSGYWQATGNFTDESGFYDASSIQIGDLLCFTDAGIGYYLPVTEIVSATPPTLTIKVSNVGITNIVSLPTALGAICRPSTNVLAPSYVAGVTNPDLQTILGYFTKRITSELGEVGWSKLSDPVKDSIRGRKDTTVLVLSESKVVDFDFADTRRYSNVYFIGKGVTDTAQLIFLNPPAPEQFGTVFHMKADSGGVAVKFNASQGANNKNGYFLKPGQRAEIRALYDAVAGFELWEVVILWDSIVRDKSIYTDNGTIPSGTTRDVGLGSTGSLRYRTTPNNSYESKYLHDADDNIGTGSDWYLRAGQPVLPLSKSVQVYHLNYAQKYGGWTSDYSHQLRLERTATNNFSRILFRSAMNTDESEEKKEARLIIATDSVNLTAISALHMRSFVGASPRHQWAGLISNSYGNGGWGNEQARFISYLPSFKIQSNFHSSNTYYDWFKVDNLDQGDTTSYDAISVYNNKYRLPNKTPNTSSGVVNVLTWTGTGLAVTPGVQNIKNAITGTARVIPYMNSGGRLYAGNDYFKLDTNTTSGAQARVRLLINNPSGTAGEGDSYSSLSVRTGDGTSSESIMNFGDQAFTNGAVGYDAVIQGYRTNGTFLSKSNLTNGQLVVKFAARGQANGGSRALGHFGITYTGNGTSINSELSGNSAVSGSVVAGFKLDNQSRFWLGSGADDYYMPTIAPSSTSGRVSKIIWTGNGTGATPSYEETIKASATLDFPSLSPGVEYDLTITVSGATEGDITSIGYTSAAIPTSIFYMAWVSAANTVTVRCLNRGGGTIDLPATTYKVLVTK